MDANDEQYKEYCDGRLFNGPGSMCPVCIDSGKSLDVILKEYVLERDKFVEEYSWDLFRSDFLPKYTLNAGDYI